MNSLIRSLSSHSFKLNKLNKPNNLNKLNNDFVISRSCQYNLMCEVMFRDPSINNGQKNHVKVEKMYYNNPNLIMDREQIVRFDPQNVLNKQFGVYANYSLYKMTWGKEQVQGQVQERVQARVQATHYSIYKLDVTSKQTALIVHDRNTNTDNTDNMPFDDIKAFVHSHPKDYQCVVHVIFHVNTFKNNLKRKLLIYEFSTCSNVVFCFHENDKR